MTAPEELIARISEALLGYREGSPKDILNKANELKELESAKYLVESKESIITLAASLSLVLDKCTHRKKRKICKG